MQCPICKKMVPEPDEGQTNGNYPFCSSRCKLIDLGRWLGDRYQIPADSDEGIEKPDRGRLKDDEV